MIANFLIKFINFCYSKYFQAEIRGLENIPEGGCLFVGNHNMGIVWCPEIWIFGTHYYLKQKKYKQLRWLAHDLIFRIPIARTIAKKLGVIPASFKNGERVLNAGDQLVVFPGGGWDSCRPSSDRDKIDFNGRTGFAKLAKKANVPIVPIVTAGAHDGWYIWSRGDKLCRFLGLDKRFRQDFFPIGLAFPFGISFGNLIPYIPLPSKIIVSILPPISPSYRNYKDLADEVVKQMQDEMDNVAKVLPRSKSTSL